MKTQKHLQLLPDMREGQNHSDVFSARNFVSIEQKSEINSVLDLYFQWQEHRTCRLSLEDRPLSSLITCEMDYDRDEGLLSEIRVKTDDAKCFHGAKDGSPVQIVFQVFKVTYVFSAPILALSEEPDVDGWHIIVEAPSLMRKIKARGAPRVIVDDLNSSVLPEAYWEEENSGDCRQRLRVLEIGMSSLKVTHDSGLSPRGRLRLGEHYFNTRVFKTENTQSVLTLQLTDSRDYGAFFETYTKIAYPSLRGRYALPLEEGLKLYERSGYFQRSDLGAENIMPELLNTWTALEPGCHISTADYFVCDKDEIPMGSSGLAHTHYSGDCQMWTFHQLCAIRDPSSLDLSGVLYTWRAEYLASRTGELRAWGTFRSASRWVERIYVKHAISARDNTVVRAIKMQRCHVDRDTRREFSIREFDMGLKKRYYVADSDFVGGLSPRFLNASDYVEILMNFSSKVELDRLMALGGQLADAADRNSTAIIFVVPHDVDITSIGGVKLVSDRYFEIEKQDLISFISSVEHSIAVTERKLMNGMAG